MDGYAATLMDHCGAPDAALSDVAGELAAALLAGHGELDGSEIAARLRAAGAPYVWPRAWTLASRVDRRTLTLGRMRSWLGGFGDGGERRCGVAVTSHGESEYTAVVAVDVLADLAGVPSCAPVGAWIDVDARLLVPCSAAKVIVLGPQGRPRSVPTSFGAGQLRSRFRVDREGPWLLQILADVAGGPRPVLEATLTAGDVALTPGPAAVPGESDALASTDPAQSLEHMIAAARRSEGLPALARREELDAVARVHAEHMRAERRVAHDLGGGDPALRLESAGIAATVTGENVAHAATAVNAQRSLWTSPSHRDNLLSDRFDSVGIGVARDADGTLWVCELFARLAH